ncbi:glycosyltransferase family 1 protein [Butyrivibrio sp. XB500-5]|uniref:glycosyltransferase family 4 protein n=1 Tax=Butyrivibrio sp. XB500-5 TaxID=2364880 RepID=UPI000EA893C3|nr:glycosyltransferase family 4 protein [Butyrivibrio sp. XB500-5]RKM59562.1 glycosyltransferase family 1 protein [Butyrivibrio sp. XB500-5]
MELKNQNILFFSRSTQHGGTENVVLQLCEIFHPLVNKIVVLSADGFSSEKLKPFGIKHYSIPDIASKAPSTIISVAKTLKEIVKKEQITVIHTHHRMAAFYVGITGLYRKCKFINTSHNTFFNSRALTRYAYKKASLIACGEMVKKNLYDVFGLSDVTVIHNAVKPFTDGIVIDQELLNDRESGKYLIGNIGRLSEQKGFEYYVRAIHAVVEKHPEAQFYIIGSGEDEEKLKVLSAGLPVKFLGYRTDIQNLMSQLDLVVLSSLWEGLPLTPIEAFSVGKTIVATGVDGTLEIVQDGENGLIVQPRDEKQLAEKINWLIEHPEEKRVMENKAIETFDTEFSFDILAQSYADYYRSL